MHTKHIERPSEAYGNERHRFEQEKVESNETEKRLRGIRCHLLDQRISLFKKMGRPGDKEIEGEMSTR